MSHETTIPSSLPSNAIDLATQYINDILNFAIQHKPTHKAIVVFDARCQLAHALTMAYRRCLPQAQFIDFDTVTPDSIQSAFNQLVAEDLVVLIQSTSFRLDAFRLRVELFNRSLKVIEHPHLVRMSDAEAERYIEALAYDPFYYRRVGHGLKRLIDAAQHGAIDSGGEKLFYPGPFEPAKLNVGDYSGMKNIGGQFPIGEVFTEARNLELVHGRVRIFAFADTTFSVYKPPQPITLVIEKGHIVDVTNSVAEFDQVLTNIRADEGEVWLRELGFGMNKAFSKDILVSDIGTYERMCGVHLSLGAKHGTYKKAPFRRNNTWHHVDVFVDLQGVYLDDQNIYHNCAWQV